MSMRKLITILTGLTLWVGLAIPVQSQGALGIQVLETNTGSARSIGMGGVPLPYADGLSAVHNPSGYAFQFTDRLVSFSQAEKTAWLTEFTNDLYLKQSSFGVGYSLSQLKPERKSRLDISVGLAYTNLKFDYGTMYVTDEGGVVIDTVNPNDKISAYTFSVGFSYYLELGVGVNHKKVSGGFVIGGRPQEFVTASTNISDVAFCARLPIHELLPRMLNVNNNPYFPLGFKLTPFISRVESGDNNKYLYQSDRVSSALPEIVHKTRGFDLSAEIGNAPLLSLSYGTDDQELTVEDDLSNADREGTEIGLAGTFFIRSGSYKSTDDDINIDTDGWGLSSRGLVDWLIARKVIRPTGNLLGYLLNRVEIRYDHAKYSTDNSAIDNTKFNTFSIRL